MLYSTLYDKYSKLLGNYSNILTTLLLALATKTSQQSLAFLPCSALKGVGARLAEKLRDFGLRSVQDILFHLPMRYEDRTRVTPIGSLRVGDRAVIEATVEVTDVSRTRRTSLLCRLHDGTGHITLRFFHFSTKQQEILAPGKKLRCFGEVRGWSRDLEMVHPEFEFINDYRSNLLSGECLTPVYPATEGITQRVLRSLTDQALLMLNNATLLPDLLPDDLLRNAKFPDLAVTLRYIHRPPPDAVVEELLSGTHPAQQRLAFEELVAHHLSLRRLRVKTQQHAAPPLLRSGKLIKAFLAALPFQLTAAQQRVDNEIAADLMRNQPMLRLLQGDVGSGKTVVAALAALQSVENDFQAALMAPTELLAEQHFQNFRRWLEPLGIQVAWLAGKLKGKARDSMLATIASGEAMVMVGTHALFQDDVQFKRLGLVMIDEQHRFGVQQRLALREKGIVNDCHPHQLIMTATPIPRTLAMTAYADLDNSIIDELPPGRTPVQTVVISDKRRAEVITHVREACTEKRQVYWVCPLIEESELLQCQAAETTATQLAASLPAVRIGLVHGRMPSQQKETVMAAFKAAELDLLVATTVIEVGVDVPNASLMVIENAERLGLAQLHQLRGRVGRGATASYCVLLYQSGRLSTQAKERLSVMRETNDGFVIARRDLELRGPGEVLGTRQAGMLRLRIADLLRDKTLLPKVQSAAEMIMQSYSEFIEPLIERWITNADQYGKV